jgi:uncharacterized protein YecE (DUF72 family)
MKWFIGCSGFYYRHWRGLFYPEDLPQKEWFRFYCSRFNTVELNTTFYNFPKKELLKSWYSKSPASFNFAVKVPRLITHFKKFVEVDTLITEFYDVVIEGLKEKLGTILFQLPPSLSYSEEKLLQITAAINPSVDNVIEFRHASWWNKNVYEVLEQNKITFCGISYPSLPDDIIATAKTLYYRLHGVPELYRSPYSISSLENIFIGISSMNVKKAFVYFNNDGMANAVKNALILQNLAEFY